MTGYDDALAAAGILLLAIDRAGIIVEASPAAQLLLAAAPSALVGEPITAWLYDDHATMAEYQLLRGGAASLTTAWRWRTATGDMQPLIATWARTADGWSGVLTRGPGEPVVADGIGPVERGHRHLATAQKLARLGSFTIELATGRVQWSETMYGLHDWDRSRRPPATQAEYLAVAHPDDVTRLFEAGRITMAGAIEAEAGYRVRRADGSWRHLHARVACEREADGTPRLLVGVVKDTSDERVVLDELIRDRERARADASAKTRFLTQVTHELRTPLAGVIGMIDLAATDTSATSRADHLASARASARHLLELIDDLLDASREDAWQINVVTIAFDLRDVMAQALAMVSPRARKKGLLLHGDVTEMATARRGDPLRLRQILINLLYNAVKYTPRGRVTATVRPGVGDEVIFTITDTGVGIAADQQAAVFEPFVQANRDDGSEGVGLGLAITRELIALLGGTITMRSQIGSGTEITVVLRLPQTSGPASDRVRTIDPSSTPALMLPPLNSRALKLLLAEDHPTNAAIVLTILERAGHRVQWVTTGAAAVAAVTAERFDAVLMDLEMPELDGAEATRRIRAAEHAIGNLRVPIIALSAHARAELTAAAAGMDAYLAKPLDVGALGLLLEQVIEHGLRAPIDHTARLAKVGGRAELARTIIATFLSHQPTLTEGIDAALASQEREDLHRAAHGLRGALLMVGACEAAAIADLLERADPATAAPLRQRLAIEIARAGAELALAQ